MEITPLVSICSITYNHAPYIRQCLDGFLMQQTTFPIEIIINDDCSTDGTTEIVKEYAEKYPDLIRPIFHEENQYQKGVKGMFATFVFPKARGKYIAMCEGDDYWTDPLKLQKQVDFLEANPEYGLVHTKANVFVQEKGIVEPMPFGSDFSCLDDLLLLNRIATVTTCCRTELVKLYQTEHFPQWRMGDYPLWLFIASKSKVHFIDDTTAVYRVLEESASHFVDLKKNVEFLYDVFSVRYFFSVKNNRRYLLPKIAKSGFYSLLDAYLYFDSCPDKYLWRVLTKSGSFIFKLCLVYMIACFPLGRRFLRHRYHTDFFRGRKNNVI